LRHLFEDTPVGLFPNSNSSVIVDVYTLGRVLPCLTAPLKETGGDMTKTRYFFRAKTIVLVAAVLLITVAGVAVAKNFTCAPGSTDSNPCNGTKKADTINGTEGNDYIKAKAGKDKVFAKGGSDNILGGGGGDTVEGGSGNDVIQGDAGNDTLTDTDDNGPDFDDIIGGFGDDIIDVKDGDPNDLACSGGGTDTIIADVGDKGDQVNQTDCLQV
jgi:Ca2+-binding RTX toxin-like protein